MPTWIVASAISAGVRYSGSFIKGSLDGLPHDYSIEHLKLQMKPEGHGTIKSPFNEGSSWINASTSPQKSFSVILLPP
jgi:hypothetical protein